MLRLMPNIRLLLLCSFVVATGCTKSREEQTERKMAKLAEAAELTKDAKDLTEGPAIDAISIDALSEANLESTKNKEKIKITDQKDESISKTDKELDDAALDLESVEDLDDPSDQASNVSGLDTEEETISFDISVIETPLDLDDSSEDDSAEVVQDPVVEVIDPDLGGEQDDFDETTGDSENSEEVTPNPTETQTDSAPDVESDDSKKSKPRRKIAKKSTIVFVSSDKFSGDLMSKFKKKEFNSGLDGADYRCQHLAKKAGLKKNFKAILSDSNWDLDDRISLKGRVYNTIGERLSKKKNDFLATPKNTKSSLLQSKILYDEWGEKVNSAGVWTGLNSELESSTWRNCQDWTTKSKKARGKFGRANKKNYHWFSHAKASARCHKKLRLYCISQ